MPPRKDPRVGFWMHRPLLATLSAADSSALTKLRRIDAKADDTRQRRLETAVGWIAEGKGRNWKYEKKK